jgi:hypothetical protein
MTSAAISSYKYLWIPPVAFGKQKAMETSESYVHIQPTGNKKFQQRQCERYSDWSHGPTVSESGKRKE